MFIGAFAPWKGPGIFVPPGSRPGIIVPAPLGTHPAVVMATPPVGVKGLYIQHNNETSNAPHENVTVIAPSGSLPPDRPCMRLVLGEPSPWLPARPYPPRPGSGFGQPAPAGGSANRRGSHRPLEVRTTAAAGRGSANHRGNRRRQEGFGPTATPPPGGVPGNPAASSTGRGSANRRGNRRREGIRTTRRRRDSDSRAASAAAGRRIRAATATAARWRVRATRAASTAREEGVRPTAAAACPGSSGQPPPAAPRRRTGQPCHISRPGRGSDSLRTSRPQPEDSRATHVPHQPPPAGDSGNRHGSRRQGGSGQPVPHQPPGRGIPGSPCRTSRRREEDLGSPCRVSRPPQWEDRHRTARRPTAACAAALLLRGLRRRRRPTAACAAAACRRRPPAATSAAGTSPLDIGGTSLSLCPRMRLGIDSHLRQFASKCASAKRSTDPSLRPFGKRRARSHIAVVALPVSPLKGRTERS